MNHARFWVCLAFTSLAAAVLMSLCPVRGEGDIYKDVLRLRVVAASDGEEDQADKLAVRDAVLRLLEEDLAGCRNREEAERTVKDMAAEIAGCASDCLLERGARDRDVRDRDVRDRNVRVSVEWECSPRRDYGDAILPAGVYRTLKVTIGEGEGQNWWCVLFPGICSRYAAGKDDSVPVGLTPEEYRLITGAGSGKLRVRFWILEKMEALAESIRIKSGDK